MNCKQGDLAFVVWATNPDNVGKIVRCLSLHSGSYRQFDGTLTPEATVGWRYEPILHWPNGRPVPIALDCQLRPLRDPGDDARDETLDWKPIPCKETA